MLRCFCCRSAPVKAHHRKMPKRCVLGASGNTGGWFYQPNMVTNRARDQGNHATHKDGCLAVDAQVWCRMPHVQPFSYMLQPLVCTTHVVFASLVCL